MTGDSIEQKEKGEKLNGDSKPLGSRVTRIFEIGHDVGPRQKLSSAPAMLQVPIGKSCHLLKARFALSTDLRHTATPVLCASGPD